MEISDDMIKCYDVVLIEKDGKFTLHLNPIKLPKVFDVKTEYVRDGPVENIDIRNTSSSWYKIACNLCYMKIFIFINLLFLVNGIKLLHNR